VDAIRVLWRDAYFDFDGDGASRDDYLVTSLGFLVEVGESFLTIAAEVLPDGDGYRAITHIPRSVIEEIAHLSPAPQPRAFPEPGGPVDGG
jgi:hypothetical protein